VIIIGQQGAGRIVAQKGSTWNVAASLNITGPVGNQGVQNDGTLNVQSALNLQNVNLQGAGAVVVPSSGSVSVNTGSFAQGSLSVSTSPMAFLGYETQISLASINPIPSGDNVQVTIGSYSATCNGPCKKVTSGASADNVAFRAVSP
jgi:hypothetical protein